MRKILFRGKRKDNGEWVEGYFVINHLFSDTYFIGDTESIMHRIIPETVGQYTGFMDINGNRIFEGDICHFYGGEHYSGFWELNHTCEIEFCHICLWYLENSEYVEVIGNIFDNPELLEEGCL